MRKLSAAVLALGLSAATLGGLVTAAGASAPAKELPVKLDGTVNAEGTGKVKSGAAALSADNFFFKRTFVKGKAGATAKVTITNDGDVDHTFTIDAQDVDEQLSPGDSVEVDVTIPDDGKPAAFYCRFHKATGMQGAFFSKRGGKAKADTTTNTGSGGGYGY